MKRKGFRRITVDGVDYQYAVSLAAQKLVFYSEANRPIRREVALPNPFDDFSQSWRGKRGSGAWSSCAVAALIKATMEKLNND